VADQGGSTEGLMIFDLSNLPNSVTLVDQTTAFFSRAHNIFVDTTSARMYVPGSSGSNGNPSGLVVLDLSDPENPVQMSSPSLPGGYVHDVYVRNDTAYCSHGTAGLYVYDFVYDCFYLSALATPVSEVNSEKESLSPQSEMNTKRASLLQSEFERTNVFTETRHAEKR
jgi:hypothetical protein